ncbi:MAG TPA: response regulator transcription factor [Herpetosiphonaceae bacterium]
MPIRVLLADDHPLVRFSTHKLLTGTPGITVVGEASDGVEALQRAVDLKPDVLVLDIEMPGLRGDEVVRRLRQMGSSVRILVLSAYPTEQAMSELLASGADDYVVKHASIETIVQAVRRVMTGEDRWRGADSSAQETQHEPQSAQGEPPPLTERETEVLKMVAVGKTDQQIALRLNITERTVRYHLHNMYRKLGISRRCEAVVWALRAGLSADQEAQKPQHVRV